MFEFECVVICYTVHDAKWHDQICTLTCDSTAAAIPHGPALMWMLILIDCMKRHRVGSGRTGSTSALIHVWIWMGHYILCVRPTMNDLIAIYCTLACYSTTTAMTYIRLCAEYMERYRVDFERTESKLVLVYVGIWICYYYLLYDAARNHHNCKLACYWTAMTITYGSALMLIEYMERNRVDVDRTESKLLLALWIWMCHYCLIYVGLRYDYNWTRSAAIQLQWLWHMSLG